MIQLQVWTDRAFGRGVLFLHAAGSECHEDTLSNTSTHTSKPAGGYSLMQKRFIKHCVQFMREGMKCSKVQTHSFIAFKKPPVHVLSWRQQSKQRFPGPPSLQPLPTYLLGEYWEVPKPAEMHNLSSLSWVFTQYHVHETPYL